MSSEMLYQMKMECVIFFLVKHTTIFFAYSPVNSNSFAYQSSNHSNYETIFLIHLLIKQFFHPNMHYIWM